MKTDRVCQQPQVSFAIRTLLRMVARSGLTLLALAAAMLNLPIAHAQTPLTTVVDAAFRNSPRVKSAGNDVERAIAALQVSKDIYIPSIVTAAGIGDAYGITLSVPTIFTINAQSLVYSAQQRFYIRAARSDLAAARLALAEARAQVEEDAVITYVSLDHAQKVQDVVATQYDLAQKLVAIVEDRVNAKLDSDLELIKARRNAVQLKLQKIRAENEVADLQDHLASLTGIDSGDLKADSASLPAFPSLPAMEHPIPLQFVDTPGLQSAEASAKGKRDRAEGDSKYAWRPQVSFAAQYGRISPIENVGEFYNLHGNYNTASAGVEIQFPLLDRVRKAAAKASTEDAIRAANDLAGIRGGAQEDRLKLQRSLRELDTMAELAQLELKIAQSDLNTVSIEAKGALQGLLSRPKRS